MHTPAPTATPTLESLPDEARVWIYPVDRDLTAAVQETIIERMHPFLSDWQSHGRRVRGAAAILYGRFVVVAATLDAPGDISGCGIDASVHALQPVADALGIRFCNPLDVHYRAASGSIVSVDRLKFKQAVAGGLVDGGTAVYNTTLQTLGELRTRGIEVPARESWHARAFSLS